MPGTPSTSAAPSTGGFWLTVELIAVEFQKSCISTALCHQPAFKLASLFICCFLFFLFWTIFSLQTQTMTLNGQKAMMSWPLEGGAQTLVQVNSQKYPAISKYAKMPIKVFRYIKSPHKYNIMVIPISNSRKFSYPATLHKFQKNIKKENKK
jgi:hypothetical protein